MTPEEIKAGHTYELTSGTRWTVKSFTADGRNIIITDGEVTTYDTPRNFARYAVRDITPAPESDQDEKVAQAQSQGPSRGCGDYCWRCRRGNQSAQPATDAINADLLAVVRRFVDEWDATWTDPDDISHEWAELYRQAKAAIARAEAGTPSHPRFRHRRTGDIYELLLIANEHAERTAQYPPTAVYRRVSDRTVWSRPVQDWGKDFEEMTGE